MLIRGFVISQSARKSADYLFPVDKHNIIQLTVATGRENFPEKGELILKYKLKSANRAEFINCN